jgi:type II secretory pathway component PulL
MATRVVREPSGYTGAVRSHEWIDRRSLALHEAVAAKLEAQPQLLDIARRNLDRWLKTNRAAGLREWRTILDSASLPDVLALLRSPSEKATRLRQSSPFAGLLTSEERRLIMASYESRRT